MKKLLGIVVLSLFFSVTANANETYATCMAGDCEFLLSIWYDYAETNCMETLFNERVYTGPISFEIIESGKTCLVFNER
ncbi:hypothetical protein N9R96_00850 [Candidatus Pelagibacter sp.]|nr:hypothetical protein [Candidatus Pelagibacter sp.]MDA9600039.1 hypothetical protein [Candidatus Pelagibacter sp.]